MSILKKYLDKRHSKISVLLQTENSECGLACLGMIASFHGFYTDLSTLRAKFPTSQKGCTIKQIMEIASRLKLVTRPVKADFNGLPHLKLPCILHWNFNHFVVLEKVSKDHITILDPSIGRRDLTLNEAFTSFTGVALELWPDTNFEEKSEKRTIKVLNLLGQLVSIRKSIVQIVILAISLEVFGVLSPLYIQLVLDKAIVGMDYSLLNILAFAFVGILLFHRLIEWMRSWMLIHLSTIVNLQWKSNVFHHLLHLPVNYFEKRHLGDVISRFNSIDVIQRTLTVSFIEAILDGLMVIITFAIMIIYSPMLSLVSVIAMLLYICGRYLSYASLKKATEERIIHEAKLSTNIIESVRGMRSISLFSKQSDRHSLTANHLVDLINAGVNVDKIKLNYSTMNSLIFGIERILVFFFGAQLVLQGAFTVGVLIAFNIYREKFDLRISSLIDKYFDFRMLRVQADRLADIVLHEKEPNIDLHQDTSELAPSIKLSNVSFAYAEGEQKVLENISFEVNAGESVAIVGPSGAGKSTLINLLLGIISPQSGTICIGNTPLNKIGFNNLRKVVGTVMQDDTLFSGSISDNICFFDHSKEFDRIIECAKLAHIHDEIIAMPMRYDTLIGDMGTALSGGQKQRLLIARALYKEPKILVLDEATSHLDVELERKVNASIRQLSVTRIIVAHRPETIQSADRIIDIREVSNIPKEANPNNLLPQLHHEMRPVT